MQPREIVGGARRFRVVAFVISAALYAADSSGGIILTDQFRSVDARASLSYVPLPPFAICFPPHCPPPVTIVDDPFAKTSFLDGPWSESIEASVQRLLTTHSSSASQDSSITLSGDSLSVIGLGGVQVGVDSPASSTIMVDFSTDQPYSYSSTVTGGFSASGNIAPNRSGILLPGQYSWSLLFSDNLNRTSLFDFQRPTFYDFALQLEPYTAPPSAIPEPSTIGLLALGLAGLAARSRVG